MTNEYRVTTDVPQGCGPECKVHGKDYHPQLRISDNIRDHELQEIMVRSATDLARRLKGSPKDLSVTVIVTEK